jgi:hypothetical protein
LAADPFDPYAILGALERHRVSYVLIGGIARVLHGTTEITSDVDICPQQTPDNLRHLEQALASLNATERESPDPLVREYTTNAGSVSVVEEPTGIDYGYNGLRRQANREAIGQGLRISIANVSDLVRNLEHLERELDTNRAEQLRTIVDLERSLGRGRGLGMEM